MTDIGELKRLAADLGKASKETTRKASLAVRKSTFDIERLGKQKAPVDTGNLRNSISSTIAPDGLSAEIGPTAYYGIFVELPTRRTAAQPFMGPAAQEVEPGFVAAMEQIGGQILD